MTPATANDLAFIKRSVTLYLKQGPRTKSGLDAMVTLVEELCQVIRKQEGIEKPRKERENEDSAGGLQSH